MKMGVLHVVCNTPVAVEPHSGSSLRSEVWSRRLNLQANFLNV